MRISDWSSDVCSSDLLAAWRATHGKEAAAASAASPTAEGVAADNPGTGEGWRIQIGAYTGRKAAEAAWEQVRRAAPGLAAYRPYYEEAPGRRGLVRSEEHTSELQSLMRSSYAVVFLKKKIQNENNDRQ